MGSTADFVIPQRLPFSDQPELLVSDQEPSIEHRAITNTLKPSNRLELLAFKGAFVTPTYGVHDQHGRPFLGSNLTRGCQPETNVTFPRGEPTSIEPPTRIDISLDAALFLNYLQFQNFGHLLTETSSSIYPLLLWSIQKAKAKHLPILINEPQSSSNAQLDELRQLFGLSKSQVISIGGDIKCVRAKTLFQAAPTHINRRYCSNHHSTIVRHLLEKKLNLNSKPAQQTKHQKIYISRTKLKESQRQLPEEQQLIEHLSRAGWIIFHPQEHPIETQLKTYQMARDLCCLEGSALHLLFGVDCTQPPNVILICRKRNNNFTRQLEAQTIPHHVLNWLEDNPNCGKPPARRDVRLKAGITVDALANAIEERCTQGASDEV
jgi:capsular polysaccharide biosynthesis protein